MACSQLSSRSEWQIGEEAEILPSAIPIQPGTELAITWHRGSWCSGSVGSPGHQQGSCCLLGAQGSLGAWPPNPGAAGSPQPASLQICCQLEEGEQFHHPWSFKAFFKKKGALFGDGILFSQAGVEAMGIIMGKNERDAFQALSCSLSLAACLWFPIRLLGHFRKAPPKLWLHLRTFRRFPGAATALVTLEQNRWVGLSSGKGTGAGLWWVFLSES